MVCLVRFSSLPSKIHDPDMSWELEDCFPLNISDWLRVYVNILETGGYGGLTKHHGDIMRYLRFNWDIDHNLVGGWPTTLKNMKVSWDDYSILFPIYGKIIQMFQTTKQFRLLTQPPQNIRCDLVASSSQRISAEDVSRCTLPCVHWDLAVTSNAWWMSNEKIYIYTIWTFPRIG